MDCGRPRLSLPSTERRVASPRAAKTDALASSGSVRRLFDMPRDVLDLLAPAALIHAESFATTLGRDLVEARFDDAQQGSAGDALQRELDERRRLAGIILIRFDRVRVPGEREQALRLHGLDDGLPADMLVARMRDLSAANLARHERAV